MPEKTNEQLTNQLVDIQAYVDAAKDNDLLFNTSIKRVGLKDGSGVNGDMFLTDSSLFFKRGTIWYNVPCVSIFFGA